MMTTERSRLTELARFIAFLREDGQAELVYPVSISDGVVQMAVDVAGPPSQGGSGRKQ